MNGTNNFQRFNPVIGATYKITPEITTYAGYSESNRAPTPSELGCADPARPCLLDNFLVSDPPLQQVVGRTWEAGFRGRHSLGDKRTLSWNVGAYLTETQNDILNVPSTITGRGFFQNVGGTRREGVEAGLTYDDDKWKLFAGYSYINATFRDAITLSSPNNPFADADGLIHVQPGNHLPSIPQHRFKASAEYALLPQWKVGANLIAFSGQYFAGDEFQPKSEVTPLLGAQSAHDVPDFEELRSIRAGSKPVRQALLHLRNVLRYIRSTFPEPDRSTHAQPGCTVCGIRGAPRQTVGWVFAKAEVRFESLADISAR